MPAAPALPSIFGTNSISGSNDAAAAYAPPTDFECPSVTIRQGASTLMVSADEAEQSPLNLRYQVGFAQTARECRLVGDTLTMKVGVQGRVILGPAGGPGQIDVPFRVAVVREGVEPRTIVTKLERLAVTIPSGDTSVLFSHVEENLSFPMPSGGEIDSYVVYVGFDPIGAREMDRKKPAPRPSRSRRSG
jgi:hypothetical protein